MKIKIILTLVFLNLPLCASDLPSIRSQDSFDFLLDLNYLNDGNIQYFSETYSTHDFKKLPRKIVALDFNNFSLNEDNHFILYKFAFAIPINSDEIFNKNLYTNKDFILANNIRLIDIDFPDENNPLLQTLTLEGRKVGIVSTKPTVFTVQFSELDDRPNNDLRHSHIISTLKNLEEDFSKARTMFCETLKSKQKIFVGGITIANYYSLEKDKTLVVFFKLAAIRPSFLIKTAIKLGATQIFFEIERRDARNTVKKIREYLKSLS